MNAIHSDTLKILDLLDLLTQRTITNDTNKLKLMTQDIGKFREELEGEQKKIKAMATQAAIVAVMHYQPGGTALDEEQLSLLSQEQLKVYYMKLLTPPGMDF